MASDSYFRVYFPVYRDPEIPPWYLIICIFISGSARLIDHVSLIARNHIQSLAQNIARLFLGAAILSLLILLKPYMIGKVKE